MAFEAGLTPPDVERFEAIPGRGVTARIAGTDVVVGSPRFLTENGVDMRAQDERMGELEEAGRTVIAVARDGHLLGMIAFGDAVRKDAAQAITALQTVGVRTVLITGDNRQAGERIARELGIDAVHAGVLPGEKASLIRD